MQDIVGVGGSEKADTSSLNRELRMLEENTTVLEGNVNGLAGKLKPVLADSKPPEDIDEKEMGVDCELGSLIRKATARVKQIADQVYEISERCQV